nr:unnamed protein product [Callosobruchus analis]
MEKMLEYVFKDTTINICVYCFERHRQNRIKKMIEPKDQAHRGKMSSQKKPLRQGVISGGEQSYADLVRGLRNDVDLKGLDGELPQVKKTQRGEVLLEINKGSADAIHSAIHTQLKTGRDSKLTRQTAS